MMEEASSPSPSKETLFVVDDWPMNLEATRTELKKAQKRLERYQAALRLADVEIKRRNRSIIALTTFAYQASHTANPSDLLKLALVQSLETTNAPVGAILLIDAESKELTLGVHKGLTPELIRILTGHQLDKGATALMPHLVAGAGALLEYDTSDDEVERTLLAASQLTSLVSLSLQIGPRLIGALLIGVKGKRHFTPAELCFLMAMSQETAVALESLRLREGLWLTAEALLGGASGTELQEVEQNDLSVEVSTPLGLPEIASAVPQPAEDDLEQLLAAMMEAEDEVQQQNADLQTLNTISEMINRTLDLREILQCTVDQTRDTLNTDAAWLYLIDDRNQLEMQAHTGLSTEFVRGMQFLKLDKGGIEGRVVAENKAHFVESVVEDTHGHKIWVDKEQLQALAVVPITRPGPKSGGQTNANVLGVLAAGKRSETYLWNPREVRLLTSIANQVALAIDNAQLYAQVHEGEVGLRAGNQILQEINDMLLEKNAHLEGFIQSDLTPALSMAFQTIQSLVKDSETLTDGQRKNVVTLEKIIDRLSELAQEASVMSETLDSAFGEVLDSEEKQDFTGSIKPIRLEKRPDQESKPASAEEENNNTTTPLSSEQNSEVNSQPMSFEDAVAAGLVPGNILDRETKEE